MYMLDAVELDAQRLASGKVSARAPQEETHVLMRHFLASIQPCRRRPRALIFFIALSRLTMPKYVVFYSDSNVFFNKLLGTVVRVRPLPRPSVAVSFLQFYTGSKNHMSLGHL